MEDSIEAIRKAALASRSASSADGDCPPLEQRLGLSLDVSLSAEDLELLKAELQGCPPCLEFVESLKATVSLCRDFGVDQAPAPLAEDTRSRMVAAYQNMLARRGANPA
ncbi:MAG: hypothetical protein U5J83_09020 [Bryobacterales bacterium]|nr:hypothetical protein [Bryobacterales bacterium]